MEASSHATATVAETIDLDVPLERAWSFVSNFETFPQWMVLHESFPDGPPPKPEDVAVGTTVKEKIKVMGIPADVLWTVEQWDPPHAVSIGGKGPMGIEMRIVARTEEREGGVRFTHESSFGGAALTPMLQVIEKEARKAAAESLTKVRALLG
jgi:carbon monoxide dehydrogenase subunit G